MKAGWHKTTLGAVAQVGAGNSAPQGDALFAEGIYPFFRTSDAGRVRFGDIAESSDYLNDEGIKGLRLLPAGTILFPKSGASTFLNHRVMMAVDGYVSSHLATIVGDESKVDRRFLLYFLSTVSAQDLVQDHAYPSLNLPLISGIPVLLPPLPEQHRIVAILDEAFDGIAVARANAEKNLQNARALFESHLQSVFTERGEGWVETKMGEVCNFVRGPFGGSLKKSIFVADGFAVYEQQHAIYDQFDEIRYFVDEAKFSEMRRFELLPNDLIMSCSGTMGRVAIVPEGIKRGIINQALLKLTPSERVRATFLKYWMESQAFQDELNEYAGGAAIQNVASVKTLKEIRIPLPSMEAQKLIVNKLDDVSAETQRLESLYQEKLTALDSLKKSLLHQAFSGAL